MEQPTLTSPYEILGGAEVVHRLVAAFYGHMAEHETELARIHELDPTGAISERTHMRFERFLVEWLGGPQLYSSEFGHPRLRMRHAHVTVSMTMRDAWLRSMNAALDSVEAPTEIRGFLDQKFADLANFLRNTAD